MTQELIERAVNCLHSVWPAWARAIPDFTDDSIHENEKKISVRGFAQTDWYSCGFTACLAVARTFHPRADIRKLYRDCSPVPYEGMTRTRLVSALRRNGVAVSVRSDLTFRAIQASIKAGCPLIAGIGNRTFADGDHWVVLYGAGWKPARVFICNQPRFGNSREELTWDEFKSIWTPIGHGLVCWGKPVED